MGALVTHMDQAASTKSWEGADATDWPAVIDAIRSNGLEPALKSLMVSDEIAKFIRCEIAACVKEKEAIALREILTGARMLRLSRLMPHLPQDNRFSVITTNYDRLVEVAAECTGFLVDTRSRGNHLAPFSRTDGAFAYVKNVQTIKGGIRKVEERVISLYKPHGSLDWTDCNGSPTRQMESQAIISLNRHEALGEWCRREDLNLRPTHYECVALPLSYDGIRPF